MANYKKQLLSLRFGTNEMYIICSIFSFLLVTYPLFRFDGTVADPDLEYLAQMDLKNYFGDIKNIHGAYRIIAVSLSFFLTKLVNLIEYKSYVLIIFFFFTNFILFKKVLGSFIKSENTLIFCYFLTTSNILTLSTSFLWARALNEFYSVMLAWIFVVAIVKQTSETRKILLVCLWGTFALLTYELHFPFLIVLLACFGVISFRTIFIGAMFLPIFIYILPHKIDKMDLSMLAILQNFDLQIPYILMKAKELLFCFQFVNLNMILLPMITVIFLSTLLNFNTVANNNQINLFISTVIIFLSFSVLLIFFFIYGSKSLEDIYEKGKLNWNILNMFCMCLFLSIMTMKLSAPIKKIFLYSTLIFPIFSGILVRVVDNIITQNYPQNQHNFENIIIKTPFKNIVYAFI